MSEPKLNTRYQCRRTGKIVFDESVGGALMVKIPYESFDEDPIAGTFSCCIGAKDGTMQEMTIKNLMEVFKVESLIDLTTIEVAPDPVHEFDLSDWEAKEKYPGFRWLNAPREIKDISSITEKWGAKLALFSGKQPAAPSTPKTEKKEVAKPEEKSKRVIPSRGKKEPRKETQESVWGAAAKKHGIKEDDDAAMETFGNEVVFPITDKLFGNGKLPDTAEQWGQLADELGV